MTPVGLLPVSMEAKNQIQSNTNHFILSVFVPMVMYVVRDSVIINSIF
jgi:hypothetical protein